jgi:hypothetical protein
MRGFWPEIATWYVQATVQGSSASAVEPKLHRAIEGAPSTLAPTNVLARFMANMLGFSEMAERRWTRDTTAVAFLSPRSLSMAFGFSSFQQMQVNTNKHWKHET